MNVTYACCQCHRTNREPLTDGSTQLRCVHCGYEQGIPAGAIRDGRLQRCVVCPSDDLFVRKDFSQRLGLLIILVGFIASSVAWFYYLQLVAFGILAATALIDVALYLLVGNLLQCYRCRAEYREVAELDSYEAFNLETHERHRQQEARLAQMGMAERGAAEKRLAETGRKGQAGEDTTGGTAD
ncbi:MAG: hypothetical protein J5I93_06245 [Pirellulaceae bacterium]|nr:hypothetical protein [Pirellulaceae bacterium]